MVMTFFAPSSSAAMVAQQPPRPAPMTSTSQSSVFAILSAEMASGAISQLCMPATSGPAEAPLSATGMPPVAPLDAPSAVVLAASPALCGAHPASPATAAPASAVPLRPKNARRERPCFFSSSMIPSSVACRGPLLPRCPDCTPDLAGHHPVGRGNFASPARFPPTWGMPFRASEAERVMPARIISGGESCRNRPPAHRAAEAADACRGGCG